MLLARRIVRSVPLEIVGSSGHEKVPTRENRVWSDQEDHEESGSKERAASTCGPHSDSFNDTSRHRRGNCSTISRHLAEANLKSKHLFRALPLTPEHRQLRLQWCQTREDDNRVRVWRRPDKRYNSSPHTHCSTSHCPYSWCNGLGGHSL
ncbi:hypothetical protein TNCV_2915211 [Trichonephila clavipes]|nr:hypothetical protein TNCV_2915211 [Trichonephila clavipes]